MHGEVEGTVALITGAGSPTGIGYATARVLGREGASLAIGSTTDRIHDRAEELRRLGYSAEGFPADLTDSGAVDAMVARVHERFERIDILVNNAGMVSVGDPNAAEEVPFVALDPKRWDGQLDQTLGTAFNITRAVVPSIVRLGWGRIVMVSSGAPRTPIVSVRVSIGVHLSPSRCQRPSRCRRSVVS